MRGPRTGRRWPNPAWKTIAPHVLRRRNRPPILPPRGPPSLSIRSRPRSAHGHIAVLSHQARRRRARQPHRRLADVPVQRHGRLRQRLAHHPSRHAREFRRRPRRRRGDPCRAPRPHHPWLPRPLFGRLRSDPQARHRHRPPLRHDEVRHPARPCRPQGVLAAPVGGRRRAEARRRPLGDDRPVGAAVRPRLACPAGNDGGRHRARTRGLRRAPRSVRCASASMRSSCTAPTAT